MAYSFRAATSAGNSSGSTVTINRPTGTADGDLIVWVTYLESDTNTWTTTPTGASFAGSIANAGAFGLQARWKIASSEPASWNFAPNASAWRTVVCAAYSGAINSGSNRVDVTGTSSGDGNGVNAQVAPSVTTGSDGDLVIWAYGNFSGTNVTSVSGFATNLRVSHGGTTISDAIQATAGATGSSGNPGGPGTEDWAAMHIGFLLDTGGAAAAPFWGKLLALESNRLVKP